MKKWFSPRLRLVALELGLLLFSALALAQSATTSISLSWTPPTKNTDGSAITGNLTYSLYQGQASGPFSLAASGITGSSTVVTSASGGNCFALAAVETIGATVTTSALTPTVCALVPASASSLQISVTITVK